MIRRPPRSTRTDTLFHYTTLFRSYASAHSMFLLGYKYPNSFETNRLQEFTSSVRTDGGKYYLKPVSHVVDSIFSNEDDNADIRTQFSYKTIGADPVIWKYIGLDNDSRLEESRVGKECVRTGKSRC